MNATTLAKFDTRPFANGQSAHRSLWLEEALSGEAQIDHEPLRGRVRADVCIVGGGLTGLWTAVALKKREPQLDVILLEADVCGGGASGRSGGFVMSWWSKFLSLRKLCGDEDALRVARTVAAAVGEIGDFCTEHAISASFHQGGWLWTATTRAQVDAWMETVEAIAAAGLEPYQLLSRDEVAERSGSPVHLAGIFEPGSGIVHPANLTRGVTRVAREMGVRICERTPVVALTAEPNLNIVTEHATVSCGRAILTLNAWAAALPEMRRALMVIASDVVATDPIPERLDRIGWARDLTISDSRRLVQYYRPTDDGRIVFGKGGGTLALGGRVGGSFSQASRREKQVRTHFEHIYPSLWDVPITKSWRGPIDYSVTGMPFFCPLNGRNDVFVGAGFSGNGLGPSYVAGRTLANLALDGHDDEIPAALARAPAARLPPEPLRYAGGLLVRAAVARKENKEDLGGTASAPARMLAGLDPTSFVDRGSINGADAITDESAVRTSGVPPTHRVR